MKKALFFTATFALCATTMMGRSLTPDEALSRLNEGRETTSPVRKAAPGTSRLVMTGTLDNTPTYYVFAQGNQTIFVGADDLSEPLLGYIDNPDFNADKMPPQMKWWLEQYSREIRHASLAQARKALVPERARLLERRIFSDEEQIPQRRRATKSAISPLCATTWDQGAPYNNLCPTKNGSETYTGCVATGMAQVMKYHNYPAKGSGSNSYTWNNKTMSMDFSSVTFDWNNMLNTYASASSGTSAQRTAIATLMKACGYSVDMEYGTASEGGSGATSFAIAPALVNNFGYDKGTHTEFRDYYSTSEWEDMMYDNLKNVGPIVYCGASSQGGHCFVCDGYNTSGYFHINWGWSGAYDGYFKLSALNPEGQGAGGSAGGYNSQQDATLGIRKPQSGSVLPESYLAIEGSLTASASSKKITFKATGGGFYNMSSYAASFTVALALTSADGSTQYVGTTSLGSVNPGYGTGSIALTVPSSVASGSYKASLVYKTGSGDYKQFKYVYGKPNYVNVTVGSSSVSVGSTGTGLVIGGSGSSSSGSDDSGSSTTDEGAFSVTGYTASTGFTIGQAVSLTATVSSTYTTAQTATIGAYLCQVSSSQYSVKANLGTQSVTVAAKGTAKATFSATLSSSLTAGTYYVVFADADGYIISEPKAVEVTAASSDTPSTQEFTVTSATVSPTKPVIGSSYTVNAKFKNTYSSTKSATTYALICSESTNGYTIKCKSSSKSVSVNANSTASVTYVGTVSSSLTAGTYYLIIAQYASSTYTMLSDAYPIEVVNAAQTGAITVSSVTCTPASVEAGSILSAKATFSSTYSSSKTISATAQLCSKSGSSYDAVVTLGTNTVTVSANSTKTSTFSATVPSDLSAGTYYVCVYDASGNLLNTPKAVTVTAAAQDDDTTGEITVTSATSSTGFTAGATCKVSATVKNTYTTSQSVTIQAYLCTISSDKYYIKASLGSATLTVGANASKTATISTTLADDLAAGTYYLVIADANNSVINDPSTVTVNAAASSSTATSEIGINSVTTSTGFTAGKNCQLKVVFSNSTAYTQSTTVTPTFYTLNGSTYTKVATLTAKSVSVTRNRTKTVTFSSTLSSSLTTGTYYLRFIDSDGAIVGNKTYSLSVTGTSASSRYYVRSFKMANADAVDADNAQFDVEVEAGSNNVNEQFVALIYPQSLLDLDEVSIAVFDRKEIASGDTDNLTFFGALNNLTPGKKYNAVLFTLSGDSFFSGFDYVDSVPFTVASTDSESTGVEEIAISDADMNAEYFTLQGVRVKADRLTPGLYIRVAEGRSTKVLLK